MAAGSDRRRELRRALSATAPYLLSHHERDDWYRCHRLSIGGRTVAVCARCSGVYPGIVVGVVAVLLGVAPSLWPVVVAVGPLPTLVDWAVTTATDRRGTNAVRTATGAALGAAYGLAVPWVLTTATLWPVGVGAVYGGLAAIGLSR